MKTLANFSVSPKLCFYLSSVFLYRRVFKVTDRAGLSILGTLGSLIQVGPQELFMQELLFIIQQTYKYPTEHACKYSINIVCKKHGKLLLLCTYWCFCRLFHVLSYNNESVFGIVTYTHDTQPP